MILENIFFCDDDDNDDDDNDDGDNDDDDDDDEEEEEEEEEDDDDDEDDFKARSPRIQCNSKQFILAETANSESHIKKKKNCDFNVISNSTWSFDRDRNLIHAILRRILMKKATIINKEGPLGRCF